MAISSSDAAMAGDVYGLEAVAALSADAADAITPDVVAPDAAPVVIDAVSGGDRPAGRDADAPGRITAFEGDNMVAGTGAAPAANAPFTEMSSLAAFLNTLDVDALSADTAGGVTAVTLADAPRDPWAVLHIPSAFAAFAIAWTLSLDGVADAAPAPAGEAISAVALVDGPQDAGMELRVAESIGDFAAAHVFGDDEADAGDVIGLMGTIDPSDADAGLGA